MLSPGPVKVTLILASLLLGQSLALSAIPPEFYARMLAVSGCPGILQAFVGEPMSIEAERAEWPFRRFFVDWDTGVVGEVPWVSHPNALFRRPDLYSKYVWQSLLIPSSVTHLGIVPHFVELTHALKLNGVFEAGFLDETLRQMSEAELEVSQMLQDESWVLCAVPESTVQGERTADLHGTRELDDGVHVFTDQTYIEVKTLSESTARSAIKRRVLSSLGYRGKGLPPKSAQASYIVIDARPSNLRIERALLGAQDLMDEIKNVSLLRKLRRLRVIGLDYDLDYLFQTKSDLARRSLEMVDATRVPGKGESN